MSGPGKFSDRLAPRPWVPLEVARQLAQSLKLLETWAKSHKDSDPYVKLMIKIQLADIEHLLDLDDHLNMLVTADRWKIAVAELELLTRWVVRLP